MIKDDFGIEYSDDYKTVMYCSPRVAKGECHIREGVETIRKGAFKDCVELTKIVIPQSVTKIEGSAFMKCVGITIIECYAINPPYCGEHAFPRVISLNSQLHVPHNSITAYQRARIWQKFRHCSPLSIFEQQLMTRIEEPSNKSAFKNEDSNYDILKMTINQYQMEVSRLNPLNKRLLHFFSDGDAFLSEVLNVNKKDLKSADNLGPQAIRAWEKWCEQIRPKLDEDQTMEDFAQNILQGHPLAEIPFSKLLNIQDLFEKNLTTRLVNNLEKQCASTVLDLFKGAYELPKASKSLLMKVKDYLCYNSDKLDLIYQKAIEDDILHELPEPIEAIKSFSLIEKVKLAIKQLCENWITKGTSDKGKRDAEICLSVFIGNHSIAEVYNKFGSIDGLTSSQQYSNIVAKFVQYFMGDRSTPLVPNVFIDSDLINEIKKCSEECLYHDGRYLCERLGLMDVSKLKKVDQILKHIFEIDLVRNTGVSYLNKDTLICVPLEGIRPLCENILQPLYAHLQKQYAPLSAIEMMQYLTDHKYNHDCLQNIDTFEILLQNYNKLNSIQKDKQILCSLNISDLQSIKYQMAWIAYREIYDGKRSSITSDEIMNILYPTYIHQLPKTYCRNQASLPNELQNKFTISNQRWTYQEDDNRPRISSMYMFIYNYARSHEIFTIEELKNDLKNYKIHTSPSTIRLIVQRFCIKAINKEIYCLESAINKHPEYDWQQRSKETTQNILINKLYDILTQFREPISYPKLKEKVIPFIQEQQFTERAFYSVMRNHALIIESKEDSSNTYTPEKPFIVKIIGDKTFDFTKGLVILNPSFDKELLNDIGLRAHTPFRQAIIARVIDILQSAPNQTCERSELYRSCKSLFEDSETVGKFFIHNVLYHHLPQNIEWGQKEDGKYYFHLKNYEPENNIQSFDIRIEDQYDDKGNTQSVAIAVPTVLPEYKILSEEDIENGQQDFREAVHKKLSTYSSVWKFSKMDNTIDVFVDYLWTDASIQEKALRNLWYEYLMYKIGELKLNNILLTSVVTFEGYLRRIYKNLQGEVITPSSGLGDTVGKIDCFDEWMRNARGYMRNIYETLYTVRNIQGHGEDWKSKNIQELCRTVLDVMALYVYTYRIIEKNNVSSQFMDKKLSSRTHFRSK